MPRRDEPLTYRSSLWGVFSATGDAATRLSISEKVLVEGETERKEEEETEEGGERGEALGREIAAAVDSGRPRRSGRDI